MTPPSPGGRLVRVEFEPRTVAALVAAAAGLWLLYRLWAVIVLAVAALVLVGTLNPVLEAMEARGLKRMTALVLLIFFLSLAAALLFFLTVPALMEQLALIVRDLPARREDLVGVLAQHAFTAPFARALSDVGLDQTIQRFQDYVVDAAPGMLEDLGYGATALFLSFYFLVDGKRTRGALYALVPRGYHMRLARIIDKLEKIVGGYVRGQLITSLAFAAFTFFLLLACGVRNALAFGLLAAVTDVLPFVGGFLAAGPAVLTALGKGPTTAVIVCVGMFLYQQFENKILEPKIYGSMLRLSSATVILAVLVGGTLMGVMGALLALPAAAALQMIIEELRVDLPGDDSDDPSGRARDEKTEAAYELMSAGATAPDAGSIAKNLAQDLRDADAWVAASEAKKKAG